MVHTMDVDQLFGLWTVIRLLGEVREIPDAINRSEVLTEAQILLTAFALGSKPLSTNQGNAITLRTRLDEMPKLDA